MSGSVTAQSINFLMLPALARLYLPETFGVFGVFIAAVSVMVVVVNLGYELTLMLPETEKEAQDLLRLSLVGTLLISGFLGILLFFLPSTWPSAVGMESLDGLLWLIPLSISLEGIIQPFGVALNRRQKYRVLTWLRIMRAAVTAAISLAGGLLDMGLHGLLAGHIGGQVVTAIGGVLVWWPARIRDGGSTSLMTLAWKYRDFPGYGMASAWLNVASKQVIFFLMPGYFGEASTGQYAKAERVLNLPPGLLSMTVGKVFFEEGSAAFRESRAALASLTWDTFLKLAALGLPVLVALLIWGPDIFMLVLGDPWRQAGEFARWLAPWLYLTMIASPLSYLIDIRRKLKVFLFLNLAMFVVRTAVIVLAAERLDVVTTVACFGAAGAGMVLVQILYLLWLGNVWVPDRNW